MFRGGEHFESLDRIVTGGLREPHAVVDAGETESRGLSSLKFMRASPHWYHYQCVAIR